MPTLSEVPGSVLIRHGDTVVAQTTAPNCTPGTRFQLASVSKQFTATAVLLLAQRGALALDDRIGRWFGAAPPHWRDITLHQLLTHTSGLGHWHDHPMIDLALRVEPDDLVRTFQQVPPLSAPGERWYYSSPGYVLLAQVVERVADRPYRDVLAEQIFAPSGMGDTFAGSPGDRDDIAPGHGPDGAPVPSWDLDVVGMGAGDVWSTTADMVTWLDVLRAGRLLAEPYRTLMVTERVPTGGRPMARGYGYGWFVGTLAGEPLFHHDGGNAGFVSFVGCLPGADRRIVMLSNVETSDPAVIHTLLASARDHG
ncbi:serine hydrolase domain-containing protein [Micromonospora sp. CPCC 205711]|uniref:serine hydrolase domain-containing protein n=1 Tax=Micromonospora sp. CPCC 205547 TaxID=3122400 RepID=UPI002FF13030